MSALEVCPLRFAFSPIKLLLLGKSSEYTKLSINILYYENISSLFDYFVIVPGQTFEN